MIMHHKHVGYLVIVQIIDSKTFTKTVDEEVLIEKKTYELEHRPRQEEVNNLIFSFFPSINWPLVY